MTTPHICLLTLGPRHQKFFPFIPEAQIHFRKETIMVRSALHMHGIQHPSGDHHCTFHDKSLSPYVDHKYYPVHSQFFWIKKCLKKQPDWWPPCRNFSKFPTPAENIVKDLMKIMPKKMVWFVPGSKRDLCLL